MAKANYVEASTQTEWAGLMQKNIVRPDLCSPASYPNTSTPPDEPLTNKQQTVDNLTSISPAEQRGQPQTPPLSKKSSEDADNAQPTSTSPLLARRQNRPKFVAHIDMPSPEMKAAVATETLSAAYEALDDEVPVSPPPSALILSPLPEANKRFAGHTPLYVGSPNDTSRENTPKMQSGGRQDIEPIVPEKLQSLPVHELIVEQDPSEDADTERDVEAEGPLTLAPNPGDGTQENIILSDIDKALAKIAKEQQQQHQKDLDEAGEEGQPLSRQGSADSRASEIPGVDGVILKKQVPLNFGVPIGTV
ncbi:hypothetical protein SLS61_001754 [Didymella pomorum]